MISKEIKKYMTAYHFWWVVLAVFAVCAIVTAVSNGAYAGLVIGVLLFLLAVIQLYRAKKFFDKLEQEGLAPQMDADFANARTMRKNKVRFGQKWIFMKGKTRLLRYEEIKQVYQYIHKQNFVEDERKLKYVDTKGKTRTMCSLELKGKSDEELREMVQLIREKNPNVIIGYYK